MKNRKTLFVALSFLLLIPSLNHAQTAANKSWNTFWAQFSSAVAKKSKAGLKKLMASENDFFSGGGGESRDEWLQMVDRERWWDSLQKSVRSGTKVENSPGRPGRVTRDNGLVFGFIGGRWRFTGPMGD
jgi:hypothetical protein